MPTIAVGDAAKLIVRDDESTEAIDMGKMKNKLEELKGKTKKSTGEATGNPRLEDEGRTDEVAGKTKQVGERIKDAFKK